MREVATIQNNYFEFLHERSAIYLNLEEKKKNKQNLIKEEKVGKFSSIFFFIIEKYSSEYIKWVGEYINLHLIRRFIAGD